MQELLLWEALHNLISQKTLIKISIVTNEIHNLFILVAYIVTIKRSRDFLVAFLLCFILSNAKFFGFIDAFLGMNLKGVVLTDEQRTLLWVPIYWCTTLLTWSMAVSLHRFNPENKSLHFWCVTMFILHIGMVYDGFAYPYNDESLFSAYYADVSLCIHIGICLSFYKPRAIIDSLADDVHSFLHFIRCFHAQSFLWYTIPNGKSNQRF